MQVYTTDTHLVIVMEYVAGGRFERFLAKQGRLPEGEARRYFGQLADAVAYCHEQVSFVGLGVWCAALHCSDLKGRLCVVFSAPGIHLDS